MCFYNTYAYIKIHLCNLNCLLNSRLIYSPSYNVIGDSHSSERIIGRKAPQDQVVYSQPLQTLTFPDQCLTSRQQHALSAEAVNKTSQEQPPSGEGSDVDDTERDIQAVRKW